MGGVTCVVDGDFRQILPVVPRGTLVDEVKSCVKASYLPQHVHKLHLSTTMRVHLQEDQSAGQSA